MSHPRPQKMIYVVEAQIGLIKVGGSRFPERRAENISAHSPCRVRLIAKWPGSLLAEQDVHCRLRAHRSHNEWFRMEGDSLDFFNEVFGRGLDRVQAWSECDRSAMPERREVLSQRGRERWARPDYRAIMLASQADRWARVKARAAKADHSGEAS